MPKTNSYIPEFDLIELFKKQKNLDSNVLIGIGDDSAIIEIPSKHQLVVCTDTLNQDVHFSKQTTAADIAYKALAVNLSDLAAMGALPKWVTLALSLDITHQHKDWLTEFVASFSQTAKKFGVSLIGGDTTRGKLSITVQALGIIPKGEGLLRSNAKAGDKIYVTGCIGDAGLGLHYLQNKIALTEPDIHYTLNRLNRPIPRIDIGLKARRLAHAAIDISDGFIQDLQHLLKASSVGAEIIVDQLPLSPALQRIPRKLAIKLALTGGDDYELCLTVPSALQNQFEMLIKNTGVSLHQVGKIIEEKKLTLLENSKPFNANYELAGFRHF